MLFLIVSANECQHALNARHASPLNAQSVIIGTLVVVQKIKTEKDLYRKLVAHSYNPIICSEILGRSGSNGIKFTPVGPPTGRKRTSPSPSSKSKHSKKSPNSKRSAADQGEESDAGGSSSSSGSSRQGQQHAPLPGSRTGKQDLQLQGDRTTLRRSQGRTSPDSHKTDLSTEES